MPCERLDQRLARDTGLSRSRIERLIRNGHATVNGKTECKPSYQVRQEDRVSVEVPPPNPTEMSAENIPLEILYEDEHIAVVNKPSGMVVHPAAGNWSGTLVNALLYHIEDLSGIGGILRPGIVHRLDKDTSGLLLIAKNDRAHAQLSQALKERTIDKVYKAVIWGKLKSEKGVIEAPIGRHSVDRKKMAVVSNGRYAKTVYETEATLTGAEAVTVHLITGRTHQIRVHFSHIGHPLLGDPIYGNRQSLSMANRLMLHAWQIRFAHPITGEPLVFEAPLPVEMRSGIQKLLP